MHPVEFLKTLGPRIGGGNNPDYDLRSWCRTWGFHPTAVWRQMTGRTKPGIETMAAFFFSSKGRVKLQDWIEVAKEGGIDMPPDPRKAKANGRK